MKILSPNQLNKADKYSIEHQNISSWELMERASRSAVNEIKDILEKPQPVTVLAGSGNNGGDGLAIAFHLDLLNYDVNVIVLKYTPEYSKDCNLNLKRLKAETSVKVEVYTKASAIEDLSTKPVIIDAIFGIGLNRALPHFVQDIIEKVNKIEATRIVIDVPSGLYLRELTPKNSTVLKADYTLTFQSPKLNFFLPDYGNHLGKIRIIDIGLDQGFISGLESTTTYITLDVAKKLLKRRKRFSHKGDYGHLLIIGGQYGMMGSVSLTAKASLKSGVGKVTVLSPKCGVQILQQSVPEAMVISSEENKILRPVTLEFMPSNICIGMGLGQSDYALETLEYYIKQAQTPMLIDADAINLLSKNKGLLERIPSKSILTPHQGELKRLIGEWSDEYDKLEKIKRFSKTYDLVVVAKDAYTFIIDDDEIYVNSTGHAGLATAGSGDTLSGIISGMLAQGYTPVQASILGVFTHGKAAEKYNDHVNSLIATDIIEHIGKALSSISN